MAKRIRRTLVGGDRVTRRRFLARATPLSIAPWLGACGSGEPGPAPDAGTGVSAADYEFLHGVASGDPLPDGVVLWTRVTPRASDGVAPPAVVTVLWRVALDAQMSEVVLEGEATTGPDIDYTVKVYVRGLASASRYHYSFQAGGAASPVGTTRTLPVGSVSSLRLAVTSCANYPQGFFHAYRQIAARTDLDVVLYLGDYIYEYANVVYGDGYPIGRVPEPNREVISLSDYRRRHAQYKLDPDLQAVHGAHPALVVWDDHDITDNAYRDGAENHQSGEGDWEARKQAAVTAFYEWIPIRAADPSDPLRIYRSFAYGDLVDLTLLDTRIVGRDALTADYCDPRLQDPARQLLGPEQEAWFFEQLAQSKSRATRWRLVGQQVAFGQFVGNPPVAAGCVASRDKWSAYPAARARVLDAIARGGIDNVVFLTGDAHFSCGLDIARDPFDPAVYDPASGNGSLAVELIVPGVTSAGAASTDDALAGSRALSENHPHLAFLDLFYQGYLLLDVTHERLHAEWYFVSSVREPAASERLGGTVVVAAGQNHLTREPGGG